MRTRSTSCTLKQYVVIGLLVSAIFGGFVPSHAQAKAGDKTSAYTISSRLPASLELVILYFLAIANVQLGIGEQAKKVHRSEDEQLLLFSQMVELQFTMGRALKRSSNILRSPARCVRILVRLRATWPIFRQY